MDESVAEKYRRLQSEIQRAILQGYPNPDRKGCPGEAVIHHLAANPDSITSADEANEKSTWYHITHCSPCYAMFIERRNAQRHS